jgi:hypothetical protein
MVVDRDLKPTILFPVPFLGIFCRTDPLGAAGDVS